ncbi:MAG: hypothetical protein JRI57_11085 [Deltaproteobacteria bacterium]|nr:hypothetical protein [Deltaproteobacteria bacterium]MBW1953850.1 hypothetical protein [Deltaproteobacteria bacterium]MBW1987711.1 hypothetical protein [Deltaproteobacteria bacterium]MBW2135431.1 hypothetical protein [Deltaproteobacteria bacterium]
MSNSVQKLSKVTIFKSYPFRVGEKIFIASGPRHGDWEVVKVEEQRIRLRCPVSQRELECNSFSYFVEERDGEPWPHIN